VRVERHRDGRLLVRAAAGELAVRLCEKAEILAAPLIVRAKSAPTPPTRGRRRGMCGFRLDYRPVVPAIVDANAEAEDEGCDSP
jgi:hypothetical protein